MDNNHSTLFLTFSSAGKLCQQPQPLRQKQKKSRDGSAVCSEWSCGLGNKDTPESTEGSRGLSWQSQALLHWQPIPIPVPITVSWPRQGQGQQGASGWVCILERGCRLQEHSTACLCYFNPAPYIVSLIEPNSIELEMLFNYFSKIDQGRAVNGNTSEHGARCQSHSNKWGPALGASQL